MVFSEIISTCFVCLVRDRKDMKVLNHLLFYTQSKFSTFPSICLSFPIRFVAEKLRLEAE